MAEPNFPESSRNEPPIREQVTHSPLPPLTSKMVFQDEFESVRNPYASPMDDGGDPFDDFLSMSGDHAYPQAMELQSMGPRVEPTDSENNVDSQNSSEVLSHSENILSRVRKLYEQGILGKCSRKSTSTPSRPGTGRSNR